jgi:CDP-glycerol glycerophosphotransferase (TagB/SpsB family)
VLYAPTWEGWGEETHHSSLAHVGVDLVRRLLAEPGVRVIYRPHPLVGTRDGATRRAHRAVVTALLAAGASIVPDLDAMAPARPGDDLDQCFAPRVIGQGAFMSPDQIDPRRHLVVTGRNPGLLFCFERSDLMVADVSAVVTDWLATGRPYAILNPADVPAEELHTSAPSTAAAALIGTGLAGLDDVLADLASGADPRQEDRDALGAYLLGPVEDDPLARFRAAVAALGDRFPTP